MYLRFWGVRPDGELTQSKKQPRPAWSYRGARRNAARDAHWPLRMRYRKVPLTERQTMFKRIKAWVVKKTKSEFQHYPYNSVKRGWVS